MGVWSAYFASPYQHADVRIYRKAQILAPVVGVVGIFSGFLAVVMFLTGAMAAGGAIALLVVSCGVVLFCMRRGWYSFAVGVFVYTLFVVMFLAIKFDAYQTVYETYVFATLGLFLLLVGGLVSVSKGQIDVLTGLVSGGIVALYVLDAFPLDGYRVTLLAIQSLVTSLLLVLVGGYFSRRIVILQQTLLEEGVRLSQHIQESYERTTEALTQTQKDIEGISGRLLQSSQVLHKTSQDLEKFFSEIAQNMQTLSTILVSNASREEEVVNIQKEAGKSLQTHILQLGEGMTVLSKTLHLVQESASTARERESVLLRVFRTMDEVDGSLRDLSSQVLSMGNMLQKLFEINALISEIAEKTHMLGLNASIEASHSGGEGKGFRIVAEEIRRLAQNAKQKSKEVGEFLGNIQKSMGIVEESMQETMGFFKTVQGEVQETQVGLKETFENLQTVANNTKTLNEFLVDFSTFGNQVKEATERMERELQNTLDQTRVASRVAQKVYDEATALRSHFVKLVDEAAVLSQLSQENREEIVRLKEKVG
ncbi:MAG: methyl-accepting chemotaxis protein [Brevinematales bacterium]|nr:methyl-accepting chemotaxis protein [Brevinematales bacterium]